MIHPNKYNKCFYYKPNSLLDLFKTSFKYIISDDHRVYFRIDHSNKKMILPLVLKVKEKLVSDYDIVEEDKKLLIESRSKRRKWKKRK
jgi:hypothetical protein